MLSLVVIWLHFVSFGLCNIFHMFLEHLFFPQFHKIFQVLLKQTLRLSSYLLLTFSQLIEQSFDSFLPFFFLKTPIFTVPSPISLTKLCFWFMYFWMENRIFHLSQSLIYLIHGHNYKTFLGLSC
jgi:hypothetical protein